jgi:hypothetical protein
MDAVGKAKEIAESLLEYHLDEEVRSECLRCEVARG